VYPTPKGDRILLGAERQLYEESLGMMADLLADGDTDFGVLVFDDLQPGAKLFALYQSGRALLRPDEPLPERVAYLDATIAAVYQHAYDMVVQEIDDPDFLSTPPSWRKMIIDAARETDSVDEVPEETSRDTSEWELVVDCLVDDVLWDRDFEMESNLDADPDAAGAIKDILGIPGNYYTVVPLDPPDDQHALYVDALMGLTPRGRGEGISQEDVNDGPDDEDVLF
jgi:hypothetical protein